VAALSASHLIARLTALLALQKLGQTIIFVRTKEGARHLHATMEQEGYKCTSIQSDMDFAARDRCAWAQPLSKLSLWQQRLYATLRAAGGAARCCCNPACHAAVVPLQCGTGGAVAPFWQPTCPSRPALSSPWLPGW
jgi:hypothetical protein